MTEANASTTNNTLRQRAEALTQLAGTYEEAQKRSGEIEALNTRLNELRGVAESLDRVTANAKAMRTEAIAFSLPDELGNFLDKVRTLRQNYNADRKSILKPNAFCRRPFDSAISDASNALKDAWRSWVVGAAQGAGLADILKVLEPLRGAADSIQVEHGKLESKARQVPTGPESIEDVKTIKATLQNVLANLDKQGVDDDILEFLKSVNKGITLKSLLTNQKVFDWIKAEDLGDQFTVSAT